MSYADGVAGGVEVNANSYTDTQIKDVALASAVALYERIPNYTAKTGTYTATYWDFVNCTSNTFTVTLPTAASLAGKSIIVKNSGTGVITVATTSAQTIDGASTVVITNRYDSYTFISDGANWTTAAIASSGGGTAVDSDQLILHARIFG